MEYISGKWKRFNMEKLILLIQENKCIYSVNSKEYLDRTKKAQAFNDIQAQMEEDIAGVTIGVIKRKWKSLRAQYVREKRLIEYSRKNGKGKLYQPKLWCFDKLSFLEAHSKLKECEDNILTHSFDIEDDPITKDDSVSSSENRNRKRPRKTNLYADLKGSERKRVGKFAWLGNLIETQMEEINPEHQQTAAWEIQMVIQKYKAMTLPHLSSSSTSTTAAPVPSSSEQQNATPKEKRDYEWLGQQVIYDINSIQSEELRHETVFKIQSISRDAKLKDIRFRNPLLLNEKDFDIGG